MTVTLEISADLYAKAQRIASAENSTVETVIREAFERELVAVERLQARANRGSLDRFRQALRRVPDVNPDPYDLP